MEKISNEHDGGGLVAKRLAVESLRVRSEDRLMPGVCQLNAYGINRGI